MDARRSPPWVRDAARAFAHELHTYVATAIAFTRRPGRFAVSWWRGEAIALNPVGMLATAAAFLGGTRQLAYALLGVDGPDGLLEAIASSLGPFAHYLLVGLLCHLVFAPLAARKATVLDSVAMALFAGAGPAAIAEIAAWIVVVAASPWLSPDVTMAIAVSIAFSVFCFALASSLAAIHDARWWHVLLAFAVAFPITGLVFGVLDPPGNYGMHWVLRLGHGGGLGLGM